VNLRNQATVLVPRECRDELARLSSMFTTEPSRKTMLNRTMVTTSVSHLLLRDRPRQKTVSPQ